MNIVAYCRVSTDSDEQLGSLINQEEFFKQFALKNNHNLIRIYSDEGISGKQMKKRPQFLQMLQDAKLGEFELVVVKDISRFARNTVDFLIAIRELKAIGIDVQFLSNNQTIIGNSEFMLTIFSAMAQEESANLSSRVKFGKKQNQKKGKVPNFIYGYNWIDRFTLSINTEESKIVKRIYKQYVDEGTGLRRLANSLSNENIPSPNGSEYWSPKTIKRILSNPIYKGVLVSRKSVSVDFITGKREMLEPEKDFIFEKEEYRIISDDYFQKASVILEKRAKQYQNRSPGNPISTQYPFSTLIKCEDCGYSYTRRLSNNVVTPKYSYWKCSGNNNRGASFCCNYTKFKEDDLIEIIKDYLMNIIKNPAQIESEVNLLIKKNTDNDIEDVEQLKKDIKNLEDKKEKYLNMFVNNIITMERLKVENDKIDKEIKKINFKLSGQNKSTIIVDEIPLVERIENFLKKGIFTNAELRKIIEKIVINHEGKIKIHFKNI